MQHYTEDRIVEFVNAVASDIQRKTEESITDPEVKEILSLAQLVDTISEKGKPQELPLVMKIKAESEYWNMYPRTHGVNFT